jgi:sec-independent protein translocase protein TatA
MGGLSLWHILIVALLALLLFGRGRISDLMGDVAKGIKSFKKGLAEEEPEAKKLPERRPESASEREADKSLKS